MCPAPGGQGPGPWTESRYLILPLAEDLPEAAGIAHLFAGLFPKILGNPLPEPDVRVRPSNPAVRVLAPQPGLGDYAPPSGASRPRSITTTSPPNRCIDRFQQRHGLVIDARALAFSRSGHVQGLDRIVT